MTHWYPGDPIRSTHSGRGAALGQDSHSKDTSRLQPKQTYENTLGKSNFCAPLKDELAKYQTTFWGGSQQKPSHLYAPFPTNQSMRFSAVELLFSGPGWSMLRMCRVLKCTSHAHKFSHVSMVCRIWQYAAIHTRLSCAW
jgi:hypothetical protein